MKLAKHQLKGEVDTVADLLNSPNYKYGVIGSTGTEGSIKRVAARSSAFNTLYKNMQTNGWISTKESDAIARLQTESNFALFLPRSTIMAYNSKLPCNTRLALESFEKSIYGIAQQSPPRYLHIVNQFVTESLENGRIARLEHKWFGLIEIMFFKVGALKNFHGGPQPKMSNSY